MQLVGGPSFLNIIAFLAVIQNITFLVLIVNLIELPAFDAFGFQ
jgi:hypothetical protein